MSPTLNARIHELKCWPRYFRAMERGEKMFEVRKLDRDFLVGDLLELREFECAKGKQTRDGWYSGARLMMRITYIMRGDDTNPIQQGYAVLGVVRA